jgi:hypothetical protein
MVDAPGYDALNQQFCFCFSVVVFFIGGELIAGKHTEIYPKHAA